MASAAKASRNSRNPKANRNTAFNTTGGKSVTIRDGVKTYNDRPLNVTGKDGISISGKSYSRDKEGTGFNPITAASMQKPAELKLPPATQTTAPDFTANNAAFNDPATGVTAGPNGTLTVTPPETDKYSGASKLQNDFQAALAQLNNDAPSGASVQRQLERETGLKGKQQAVNDYSAQLNTIVANRDANVLRVEGQGRGIPEVIIGGQQAQINKEAAIQALPVQAQLAAAQGNLALAQDHIATWGKILMDDANAKYTRKKDVLTSVRDFAVGLEFKRIDDLEAANERKYQEAQTITKAKTAALQQALSQPGGSAVVGAIKNATTLEEIVAATGIYNGDLLGQEAQRASINASKASAANSYDAIEQRKNQVNENGTLNGRVQNVTQAAANGFADRIAQANTTLQLLGKNFTGKFAYGGSLPNMMQSADRQAYEQAKKNFATAVLRRESGASIAPSEFKTLAETYFPTAGDKPDNVFLKDQLRNTVINSFYREANVARPVQSGDIVADDDGTQYRVDVDGETLIPIE